MSKFSHIRSISDLDVEIQKTEIKKELIKKNLTTKIELGKSLLRPALIGVYLMRIITDKNASKSSKFIEIVAQIFGVFQASKYGIQLVKKAMS